jgi:NAD(P)-dependent dehydrogenase (short-subunit alcohol dehydrogenase family)
LVNNAGFLAGGEADLMTTPDDNFLTNLNINLVAAYVCTSGCCRRCSAPATRAS